MRQFGGYLLAIASGAFYGIISVIILFIARFGEVPSLFCMMVRMFFAGVLLLPFALPRLRKHRITPQFLRRMLLAGIVPADFHFRPACFKIAVSKPLRRSLP